MLEVTIRSTLIGPEIRPGAVALVVQASARSAIAETSARNWHMEVEVGDGVGPLHIVPTEWLTDGGSIELDPAAELSRRTFHPFRGDVSGHLCSLVSPEVARMLTTEPSALVVRCVEREAQSPPSEARQWITPPPPHEPIGPVQAAWRAFAAFGALSVAALQDRLDGLLRR